MEIMTIVEKVQNSETFDKRVNKALNRGFRIKKREVAKEFCLEVDRFYSYSVLIAELEIENNED